MAVEALPDADLGDAARALLDVMALPGRSSPTTRAAIGISSSL
jgi:hypothetical protein